MFETYLDDTNSLRPEVTLFFDGLLAGVSYPDLLDAVIKREFRKICAQNPELTVKGALSRAREVTIAQKG